RHDLAEHLQFPEERARIAEAQPRVADKRGPPRVLEGEEDLRSSGGLVFDLAELDALGWSGPPAKPDLPASDATAPLSLPLEAALRAHPQIAFRGPAEDRVRLDLPLDPLDADPWRDDRLHPREEFDRLLRRHW